LLNNAIEFFGRIVCNGKIHGNQTTVLVKSMALKKKAHRLHEESD